MPFEDNVFINCPFDKEYRRLLRPLLFTCIYCGLTPHISTLSDSGTLRYRQIMRLIRQCRLSIHDLSRMKSRKANELARFNMPFHLTKYLTLR